MIPINILNQENLSSKIWPGESFAVEVFYYYLKEREICLLMDFCIKIVLENGLNIIYFFFQMMQDYLTVVKIWDLSCG